MKVENYEPFLTDSGRARTSRGLSLSQRIVIRKPMDEPLVSFYLSQKSTATTEVAAGKLDCHWATFQLSIRAAVLEWIPLRYQWLLLHHNMVS